MLDFELFKAGKVASIVLEDNGVHGMKKMTGIFAEDIERVTGTKPEILSEIPADKEFIIYVGLAESATVSGAFKDNVKVTEIKGKREVYGISLFKNPENANQTVLAIVGSDKRGAIYGMFNISETIGVSPLYYWADATVKRQSQVILGEDIVKLSKEPSVNYRGFFINDEQPCFGNWAREKFGSIRPCPELYEKIFELLLRLKGNYLWPAMWRSDFTLDHIENAQLADEMGVIMGASHHEPCCRSGQEFQTLRHDNPQYGKDWSFLSNPDGITEFWKDGLIRNKNFENLITIGMRGENDSYLMPEDATLEDNINVLKSAIKVQKELILKYAPSEHPQLLAVYKEVEDYYFGDEKTKGLKDWDVLDNDIMMLCDDNFANVRTLPDDELRKKKGGFGMYYHFDYFGEPVSYLWINSSPLTKVWEQMSMAYDYGIRSAWIVNVGDIKNQELPLSYFLDLAYDFDKWGTGAINKTEEYTVEFFKKLGFDAEVAKTCADLATEYTKWNGRRRPEALHHNHYSPCNENEANRVLNRIFETTDKAEELYLSLKGTDLEECFFEEVYYPVMSVAEINKMQIFGGLNAHYAKQRKKKANDYAKLIQECIERERSITEEFHTRNNGKWNHMQSVYHIGFTNWNDEQCQLPISYFVNPVKDSRLLVSISNQEDVTGAHRWTRHVLHMPLCFESNDIGEFEVANGGEATLEYHIDWDADWLELVDVTTGKVIPKNEAAATEVAQSYKVKLLKKKWDGSDSTMLRIYVDNGEVVADESENGGSIPMVEIQVEANTYDLETVKEACFLEENGAISIEAAHFAAKSDAGQCQYKEIQDFGKTLSGMKVFPTTERFDDEASAPSLTYNLFAATEGEYTCQLYASAANPVVYHGKLSVGVTANDGKRNIVNTIPDKGFDPWKSDSWKKGVLDNIHIGECKLALKQGFNQVKISAIDPAVVLEKIVLWNPNVTIRESYLGPQESKNYKA
ncbi:Glycosyl hydrolase family 115 [Pseudobutyrivibrio sp. YE44]|uniref:glycosyl hydrolase 115 family protein n=1 Tax=Pseudobutyrivibrio sp. YE44 TaxID=1520802 RepID=UPI00088CCE69|nr:glycosyl hydrolase 115 family protein [Pseudobutyrivibrio sp. YE44]SDB12752.1 Glycosyl hydrolase family 115 [Pseudobutyrivibrio sp. YE44]